jgi:hypothetical protein
MANASLLMRQRMVDTYNVLGLDVPLTMNC